MSVNRIAAVLMLASAGTVFAQIPTTPDTVVFSHRLHISDVGVECESCHRSVFDGIYHELPVMSMCNECHEENIATDDMTKCVLCHTNVQTATAYKPHRSVEMFPHNKHSKLEKDCRNCHTLIEKRESYLDAPQIKMESCTSCHSGKQAESRCSVCHLSSRDLKPKSHKNSFFARRGHALEAKTEAENCEMCHQPASCDKCHRGQGSMAVHEPGFRYNHEFSVRTGEKDCTVCHASEIFCRSCHK